MQCLLGTLDRTATLQNGCAQFFNNEEKLCFFFLWAVALTPGEAGGDVWGDMDLCG